MSSFGHIDKQVQKTNDFSCVSKHSMCNAGYLDDRFLQYFVAKKSKRAPIINRGYYVRMKAVNTILGDFLNNAYDTVYAADEAAGSSRLDRPALNIIVLGAGYDTLYFRLQDNHKDLFDQFNTRFIEVDFLDVCVNKSLIIQSQPELTGLLLPPVAPDPVEYDGYTVVLRSQTHALVGFDMRKPSLFGGLIKSLGLDCSAPTLILSEVVLTYIEDCYVTDIFSTLANMFPNSLFVNYEQVEPHDPFGRLMVQHFEKQSTPLLNINRYPTVDSHKERFLNAGWSATLDMSACEFWGHLIPEEEKLRISSLEPFDEYEEFMEKMRHYVIALAATGDCTDIIDNYRDDCGGDESAKESARDASDISPVTAVQLTNGFSVYGHASAEVKLLRPSGESVHVLVLIGGVSKNQEANEGVNGSRVSSMVDFGPGLSGIWISTTQLDSNFKRPLVHHAAVVHSASRNVIFVTGGRTSPTSFNTSVYTIELAADESSNEVRFVVTKGEKIALLNSEQGSHRCHALPLIDDEDAGLALTVQSLNVDLQCSSLDFWHCQLTEQGPSITQVSTNTTYPARFSSSALWGPRRVVLSGGLRDDLAVPNVFLFDTTSDDWPYLGEMTYPRFGHTSHVYEDYLIVIGGVSHIRSGLPDISVFHLLSKKEKHYKLCFSASSPENKDPLVMLFNHTSLLITRNEPKRIVVVGGGGNCFSFGTHFNTFPFSVELSAVL